MLYNIYDMYTLQNVSEKVSHACNDTPRRLLRYRRLWQLPCFVMMSFPWRESNPENNILRNIPVAEIATGVPNPFMERD
jgi:hypothetical protein